MASVPCLPACVHDVPRTSPVHVRASRALPMTLRNCSPDTLNCPPMNHCSLPCVRSQSCTRLNSLDHLSRARDNSSQNRSGCSRRPLYHAAWSSLTCLSSILRQTSRTSSAHSNSYRQKKPVTVPLSLSLVRNVPLQIGTFPFQTEYFNSRLKNNCAQSYARSCMMQF